MGTEDIQKKKKKIIIIIILPEVKQIKHKCSYVLLGQDPAGVDIGPEWQMSLA
jgi:hypothetical protein